MRASRDVWVSTRHGVRTSPHTKNHYLSGESLEGQTRYLPSFEPCATLPSCLGNLCSLMETYPGNASMLADVKVIPLSLYQIECLVLLLAKFLQYEIFIIYFYELHKRCISLLLRRTNKI